MAPPPGCRWPAAAGPPGPVTTRTSRRTGRRTAPAGPSPAGSAGSQTLLSQDGPAYSGMRVGTTGASWTFGLNTGPGTGGTFDTVSGGHVQPGQWSQVTASYDAG